MQFTSAQLQEMKNTIDSLDKMKRKSGLICCENCNGRCNCQRSPFCYDCNSNRERLELSMRAANIYLDLKNPNSLLNNQQQYRSWYDESAQHNQ